MPEKASYVGSIADLVSRESTQGGARPVVWYIGTQREKEKQL